MKVTNVAPMKICHECYMYNFNASKKCSYCSFSFIGAAP